MMLHTKNEKELRIDNLSDIITERDKQLSYRDKQISNRDKHILERDQKIIALYQEIKQVENKLAEVQNQFYVMQSSTSWKLTAPFRTFVTLVRHIFKQLNYKGDIQKSATLNIEPISVIPISNVYPPTANGIWEWSEYKDIKNSIKQIMAQRQIKFEPTPFKLIDISNEGIESAVARIKLPQPDAHPTVSIILPVYNNLQFTLECLISISLYTSANYEVIVADDSSTDNTSFIVKSIKNIRLLRNKSNLGFLRNCNQALDYVKGKYVLFLNNDVQVTEGWLDVLLGTFDSQIRVGAVGPRFVYPSGHLQEAGASLRLDGTADMVGLNEYPFLDQYNFIRRVDYVSGACLLIKTELAKQLGGFSEDYLPCYCEDSDICLRIQDNGYYVYYNPSATIIHHLSKTTDTLDTGFKLRSIAKNLAILQKNWYEKLDRTVLPRVIAFYLPQFYPFPENDKWWGSGFTEWSNVTKAQPNFIGHYQPRLPSDLGFYDLRINQVMEQQANLAMRYGIHGFCYYYYWFDGKRLLDLPVEQMLSSGKPNIPFCLCWANENWTRRWDGQENEVLISQAHSIEDDSQVITDLMRFFRDPRYIKIDGRPLILIYRVALFPNFAGTAERWRELCLQKGIGDIYIAMVESFELVNSNIHPKDFGCDATVEFPPQGLADIKKPSGEVINSDFSGNVADYRDLAVKCATREAPAYIRFRGIIPGWDNTARRQNGSFCFENSTPGAFQAWLEESIEQTRLLNYRDEKLVFINAWNEWAEGAYLEPDRRFGHTYLEAVKNALDASSLLRKNIYGSED